jgi:hypothetical protein
MRVLLKSLDKQVWVSIEKGWTRPTTDIDLWSMDDLNGCNWNKGLNGTWLFHLNNSKEFRYVKLPRRLGRFQKSHTKGQKLKNSEL